MQGGPMIGRIFTVGGFTLLSRITGFLRDIVLAAVLGAGPIADAFFVALRLPNHFRAIFAEGAFNAAFVPAYARVRERQGPDAARVLGDHVFVLLLASRGVLLAGFLEVALLAGDALRQGVLPAFRRLQFDAELKLFLKRFGPATLGSAQSQIAAFADTIIATFLATGAVSALYYADRINQL